MSFSTATDGTGARVGDVLDVNGLPGGAQQKVLDATDISNGYVDITLPAGPIPDGTYNMSATITDTFGTVQVSAAATQDLVIDTAASVTITSVADDDDSTPVSVINSNEEGDLVITGTVAGVEDGQTVNFTITDGGTVVNGSAVVSGGTFTTAGQNIDVSALNEGAITVSATVTDQQGNVANDNAAATKDTVATVNVTDIQGEIIDDDIISAAEDAAGGLFPVGISTGVEAGQIVNVTVTDQNGTTVPYSIFGVPVAGDGSWTETGSVVGAFSSNFNDGPLYFEVTTEDQAGNEATDTFTFELDTTAPTTGITSVKYDSDDGAADGTLTLTGTFNPADFGGIAGVDVTAVTVDGVTLTGASTVTSVSTTEIVIDLGGADETALEGTLSDVLAGETVDVAAGFLTDAAGNDSAAQTGIEIQYDVRSSEVGSPMFGGDLDDIFQFRAVGVEATGGNGGDSFVLNSSTLYVAGNTADINDFDSSEGDLIIFDAGDLNGAITGSPYSSGDDGGAVAFSTFNGGVVTAATNIEGTIIYDDVNKTLRIDYAGDTSWDGANLTDTSGDDTVIDLTGISGVVTASDIEFI